MGCGSGGGDAEYSAHAVGICCAPDLCQNLYTGDKRVTRRFAEQGLRPPGSTYRAWLDLEKPFWPLPGESLIHVVLGDSK